MGTLPYSPHLRSLAFGEYLLRLCILVSRVHVIHMEFFKPTKPLRLEFVERVFELPRIATFDVVRFADYA